MPDIKVFHFPGGCSRVTLTALEHIGCDYEDATVNLFANQQKSQEYLSINPRAKIPALLIDGKLLTENAAILTWLNNAFPDADLLPKANNDFEAAQTVSDLFWVSSVWHPYVRANMMPIRWTTGDPAPVKERGRELLATPMSQLDDVLASQPWYYGDQWSIIDAYFYWCYTTAEKGEFPLANYSNVVRHRVDMEAHPSLMAALKKEGEAIKRDGLEEFLKRV